MRVSSVFNCNIETTTVKISFLHLIGFTSANIHSKNTPPRVKDNHLKPIESLKSKLKGMLPQTHAQFYIWSFDLTQLFMY